MRTTLDIDDDVLDVAKAFARQTGKTAGAILSELARQALTGVPGLMRMEGEKGVGGFVPFERRGGVVTNERIDRLRERDLD